VSRVLLLAVATQFADCSSHQQQLPTRKSKAARQRAAAGRKIIAHAEENQPTQLRFGAAAVYNPAVYDDGQSGV
jgi:hypothetical protein